MKLDIITFPIKIVRSCVWHWRDNNFLPTFCTPSTVASGFPKSLAIQAFYLLATELLSVFSYYEKTGYMRLWYMHVIPKNKLLAKMASETKIVASHGQVLPVFWAVSRCKCQALARPHPPWPTTALQETLKGNTCLLKYGQQVSLLEEQL